MSILSFIGAMVDPIFKGIDSISTSEEEKGAIRIELMKLENVVTAKMLDLEESRMELEGKLVQAQSAVIIAEAQSQSWIARNWRPMVMLTFCAEIVLISTGWMDVESLVAVPEELWGLLTLGIGGYMTLRSVEKIAPGFIEKMGKKKEEG